jgi:hypothetical protein
MREAVSISQLVNKVRKALNVVNSVFHLPAELPLLLSFTNPVCITIHYFKKLSSNKHHAHHKNLSASITNP